MKRTELKRGGSLPRNRPLSPKRKTPTAKLKRDAMRAWGTYIHARDVWCQRCTKGDGKLDAHHIMIRSFAATATDDENGILLCFKCHGVMHSDPMEAVIFYTRILGIDGYDRLRQKAYDGRNQVMRSAFWTGERERLEKLLEAL